MREITRKALRQLPLQKLIGFVRNWSYKALQVPYMPNTGYAAFMDFPEPASIELITITRQEVMEYLLSLLEQFQERTLSQMHEIQKLQQDLQQVRRGKVGAADKYTAIYAVEAEQGRYDVIGLQATDGSKVIITNSVSLDYCNGYTAGQADALGLELYSWHGEKLAGVINRHYKPDEER